MQIQWIDFFNWIFPPFLVYLIHPVFMGMVIPSRLRRWWHVPALAAFVALFNIPKALWGIYSPMADLFRLLTVPVLLVAVPLLCFEGPVWKRLMVNLLLFSGQIVGEGIAVWVVTSPTQVRIDDLVVRSLPDAILYTMIAIICNILFDALVVILARTLQGRKFSPVYLPVIGITVSLWGNFYVYVSNAGALIWCICMGLSAMAFVALLYYVTELERKQALEEELQDTRHRMALEQAHYRAVEDRQEALARIRHDFNNQLATIGQLIRQGEEEGAREMIDALAADIAATRPASYCTIPVVNALLTEKEKTCAQAGVTFRCDLHLPEMPAVEPLHLCSIFANLLDNAIRAAARSGVPQPTVRLSSMESGDYLFIKTVNPAAPAEGPREGHGYGSRILQDLARRYGGEYRTDCTEGVYTAVVSLEIRK